MPCDVTTVFPYVTCFSLKGVVSGSHKPTSSCAKKFLLQINLKLDSVGTNQYQITPTHEKNRVNL